MAKDGSAFRKGVEKELREEQRALFEGQEQGAAGSSRHAMDVAAAGAQGDRGGGGGRARLQAGGGGTGEVGGRRAVHVGEEAAEEGSRASERRPSGRTDGRSGTVINVRSCRTAAAMSTIDSISELLRASPLQHPETVRSCSARWPPPRRRRRPAKPARERADRCAGGASGSGSARGQRPVARGRRSRRTCETPASRACPRASGRVMIARSRPPGAGRIPTAAGMASSSRRQLLGSPRCESPGTFASPGRPPPLPALLDARDHCRGRAPASPAWSRWALTPRVVADPSRRQPASASPRRSRE